MLEAPHPTRPGFTRRIVFHAAYDKRHPDPKQNYGVHGVDACFYLIGPKGAVQFILYTDWQLPWVRSVAETLGRGREEIEPDLRRRICEPMPADIGRHALVPSYDFETVCKNECELLGGKPCYYDGSSLGAYDVFEILIAGGDEALWTELDRRYDVWLDAPKEEAATNA